MVSPFQIYSLHACTAENPELELLIIKLSVTILSQPPLAVVPVHVALLLD